MPYLLLIGFIGIVIFALISWLIRTEPAMIIWTLKFVLICSLLLGSIFLLLTGRIIPVISFFSAILPFAVPVWIYAKRNPSNKKSKENKNLGTSMTVEEAYEILDLKPGASAQEIKKAHQRIIMKLHPDHGGSTYLSIKVNQAKDLLLKRNK